MVMAKNPITKVTEVEIVQFVPPAQSGPAEGFENMEQEDLAKPRLVLCQSQTPQRLKDDPKYIKGLTEGQFFNSITGEVYGEKVKLTPLMFFKYRLRFGAPGDYQEDSDGLMCQSPDAKFGKGNPGGVCIKCPMSTWEGQDPPRCTVFNAYASLIVRESGVVRHDDLVIVSMKSANMTFSKEWNALMRLRQTSEGQPMPMWQGIYELGSISKKFKLGSAYMQVPKNAGSHKEGTAVANICRSSYYMIREMFDSGRLQVDIEDLGREPGE